MSNIIPEFFIYFFAAYGFWVLIFSIYRWLKCSSTVNNAIRLLLVVKSQEKCIEGAVKTILSQELIEGISRAGKMSVVVEDSDDDTAHILERLKGEYEGIKVLTISDAIELMESISSNS